MKLSTNVLIGVVAIGLPLLAEATTGFFQEKYRWRNDNGSESGATWKAAENTSITGVKRGDPIRLRFAVTVELGMSDPIPSLAARLEYAASSTNGPWSVVDASGSGTNAFEMMPTTWYANGEVATSQITIPNSNTDPAPRPYAGGMCVELPTNTMPTTLAMSGGQAANLEYCFRAGPTAKSNTTYYFRLTNTGRVFTAYSKFAQLKIENTTNAAAPNIVVTNQTLAGGVQWYYQLFVTGTRPMTYSVQGLPAGITRTGTILSGRPTAYGTFPVTVIASNAAGTNTKVFNMVVSEPAAEVIVDDQDKSGISMSGDVYSPGPFIAWTWGASATTNLAWNGMCLYSYVPGSAQSPTENQSAQRVWFRWTPDFPQTALYDVYARWTSAELRGRHVPYTIRHAGGTNTVFVDQRDPTLSAQWNLLGSYTCNLGTSGWVELGGNDGQACADAIRFVRVGSGGSNQPPVITEGASAPVTMSEDSAPTAFNLTLHATDANTNTLTWSITTQAEHGTATASGTGASKAIAYTPVVNYTGADSFAVRVSDGQGGTDTITVNVTIQAINDAPTVTASVSTNRGTAPLTVTFAATGADADGDTLSYSWTFGDGGTAAIQNPSHVYASAGAYTSRVTVADGKGGSGSMTVTITPSVVVGGVLVRGGSFTNAYTQGGTNWIAHIFTNSATFSVQSNLCVEYLIVAGGGGGGRANGNAGGPACGGGGGAGGVLLGATNLTATAYSVVVGAGGAGGSSANTAGTTGNVSTVFGLKAVGGGGGAGTNVAGTTRSAKVGGSGGGGAGLLGTIGTFPGTNGITWQGYSGGTATQNFSGGGGGYASAGAAATSKGGDGGAPLTSSITGAAKDYAGGGGGASAYTGLPGNGGGTSGGKGGTNNASNGANGTVNTGGGGGGGSRTKNGGAGGSGIVIIRYVTSVVVSLSPYEQWQRTNFTTQDLTNSAISGDNVDPDHDGMSNLAEYQAGTIPTNRASCLVFTADGMNPLNAGQFIVRWQSASNKLYTLQAATNLISGFNLILGTNILATPPENVRTDQVQGVEHRFYRVLVE